MKNCIFCQTPMLPIMDIVPGSDFSVEHSMWECHACPNTLKLYTDDPDWYSILTFYNGYWYEIMVMSVRDEKITHYRNEKLPFTSVYKYTLYQSSDNISQRIKSELVMEINQDFKITPTNVKEKLAILLVFS